MTALVDPLRTSGRKTWAHLTADSIDELKRWAKRLKVQVKEPDTRPHLDLKPHKRDLALRYGAKEVSDHGT